MVVVVTDENVGRLHLPALEAALRQESIASEALTLPAGEATKSWPNLTRVVEWLLEQKVERRDIVVALGGGVIGDLVGFAAAILRRGVPFRADADLASGAGRQFGRGARPGINSPHGKNLIGAFHQPSLVLADIGVLDTLTPRDFLAGYGEVMKYGLLGDADFFAWLEGNAPACATIWRPAPMPSPIPSLMKAGIVERDETEQGERALLNLGHTFGHALESATGYSDRLLHGEGVAIGCALAFELSARDGALQSGGPVAGRGASGRDGDAGAAVGRAQRPARRCGTDRADGAGQRSRRWQAALRPCARDRAVLRLGRCATP